MVTVCLFVQVVQKVIMAKTVPNCASVGKEGSATQQLGGVFVALVGWDQLVNKVRQELQFDILSNHSW